MKKLSAFWKVYMFLFIVPFPMFLYYVINGFGPNHFGKLTNPYLALAYLGLSVFLWLFIFYFLFKNWKLNKPDSRVYFARLLGWVLIMGAIAGYYIFSYKLESNGTGWRFLRFWHPLLIIPLWWLFYSFIFTSAIKMIGGIAPYEKELAEKGVETMAKVIRATQTGVYMNQQPQVLFELEFQDQNGLTHRVKHKRIVSLMNLQMASQSTLPITYLPTNPKKLKINDISSAL